MSYVHAIVWLDHLSARIFAFSDGDGETIPIESQSEQRQLHRKSGKPGSGHAPDDVALFGDIVAAAAIGVSSDGTRTATGLIDPAVMGQGFGQEVAEWVIGHSVGPVRFVLDSVSPEGETLFAELGLHRGFAESIMRHSLRSIPFVRRPDDIVTLPDSDIFDAVLWVMGHCKVVPEGAAAAPVAALLHDLIKAPVGARVVAVLSGGNVNLDQLRGLKWN